MTTIKLTLTKFRNWDHLTLNFNINAVTLIRGVSGKGKTGIFKAIDWLLYGVQKKICPHHTPSAKTNVTLELPNMYISRTKNPNKLILKFANETYEDESAQEKINQLYGQHDVWLVSSYVPQLSHNFFLTTTNASKMELLNQLSFHQEDPIEFIDKVTAQLEKQKIILQVKLDSYNQQLKLFEKYNNSAMRDVLSKEDYDTFVQQLSDAKIQLDCQRKAKLEYDIKSKEIKKLEAQLEQVLAIILPPVKLIANDTTLSEALANNKFSILDEKIQELNLTLQKLTLLEKMVEKMSEKMLEKSKVTNAPTTNYKQEDYDTILKNETLYNTNNTLLTALDLPHDDAVISEYVDYLTTVLNAQDVLRARQDLQQLKIVSSPRIIDDGLQQDINNLLLKQGELQLELQQLTVAQKSIPCPECQTHLLYDVHTNTLMKSCKMDVSRLTTVKQNLDETKSSIQNKQMELTNLKSSLDMQQRNYDAYVIKKQQLEAICQSQEIDDGIAILSKEEKDNIQNIISRLKLLTLVPQPSISSQTMRKLLDQQTEYQKYTELLNTIDPLYRDTEVCVVASFLATLRDYYTKAKHKHDNLQFLTQQLELLRSQLVRVDAYSVLNTQTLILQLEEKLEKHKYAEEVTAAYKQLSVAREELTTLTTKVKNLELLKEKATTIECRMLNQVVDTINCSVEEVCQDIFPHDILIQLDLFKQSKTKKAPNKPQVNFNITYQGGKYDQIGEMSGGEADRVSLALTLALNRLSSFPIIMLDESLKSLDMDLKQSVIDTIKNYVHATILIIEHDFSEALVDYIIDVENI